MYLYFCPVLLVMEKLLDEKGKINFKIDHVTDWPTNNDNTHIAHYLKK